ncbi:MAG: crotonase/enoyl-CoA hydratase family protein [Nitrosomonas sp.]|nr:crotonase/enoyl-CoA hydratase family protein [Nitrosomonas sp.]
MNNKKGFGQSYEQLVTKFDAERKIMWCYMNPHPRPCFNPLLLRDLNRFLGSVSQRIKNENFRYGSSEIKYIVFGSYKPGVFSLGGDLKLFLECINTCDKNRLTEYMRLSIDVMYNIYTNMSVPVTTISLIRGNALGAGFEGALSCDYIVAEEGVQLGFPEVLFNMFPGMGAYSFLSRRLEPLRAEKMIVSGRIYSVKELFNLDLIEMIAEKGEGVTAVHELIAKHEKTENTRKAVFKMRNIVNPVTYEEMIRVGELWVECALALSEKEQKVMKRLIRSQDKIYKSDQLSQDTKLNQII